MINAGVHLLLKHNKCFEAAKFLSLAASFFTALTFFSCSSSPELPKVDIFDLIDPEASVFVYIPVQNNQSFVKYALQNIASLSEKDSNTIVSRTNNMAISCGNKGLFQIAIDGSYPAIGMKSALSKNNGWNHNIYTETTVPLTFYTHERLNLQLAYPNSEELMVSGDVGDMLKRYENYVQVSQKPQTQKDTNQIYSYLLDNKNNSIKFYSNNPGILIKSLLGKIISLGMDSIQGELIPSKKDNLFALKLEINLSNQSSTKAVVELLKRVMFPVPAKIQQTGPAKITVTDISLTYKQLVNIIIN